MKVQWKGFVLGIVFTVLVVTLAVPAFAALTAKDIQVYTGLDIYVDGVEMKPTDANGNPVEVFAYNGTTYVPLRAVSQSLGKAVNYDGGTQTVYIGEIPGQKQYLMDVCPPYQIGTDYSTPTFVTVAGEKYANSCTIGFTGGGTGGGWALYNLNGEYSMLSFDIGHVDGRYMNASTFNIYLDGALAYSIDVQPEDLPKHYDLPLHAALQMKIDGGSNSGKYAFLNAIVS